MFKLTLKQSATLFLSLFIIFSACNEEATEPTNGVDGLDGFNALVDVQDEPAGDNCPTGGVKISVGQDSNQNGTLDESEIATVNFVCNGGDGADGQSGASLVARTSPENPGNNCESGGTLVEIGSDTNGNNSLDDNEVQTSFYVCNGNDGSDGGSSGENGLTSLIRVSNSSSCANGGITIEIGLDDNDNGELDSGEINASYDLCNGLDGTDGSNGSNGLNTLINIISEDPGANCANGGLLIQVGIDDSRNSILETGEVDATAYVCNGLDGTDGSDGADGTNGISSITRVTTESAGANCANGGLKIEIGMDDVTQDGTLQNEEVDYTYYVCNGLNGNDGTDGSDGSDGVDGISTFIRTTTEPAGANCSEGGVKIELGLDANDNQVFDSGEEFGSPIYVCNGQSGADGNDGADGKSIIVTSAPAGGECTNGGTTLTFGYDNDSNGTVDDVLETVSVCNGEDGVDGTGLIIRKTAIDPGLDCAAGGTFVEIDLDENANGLFDDGPVEISFYVCNGADGSDGTNGRNSLIRVSNEPAGVNCTNGGLKIESGIDDNGNGILNVPGEVDATAYVCDGDDGSDGSDGNSDNIFEFYFQEGFDGYSGVIDVSIDGEGDNEYSEVMSVDRRGGEQNMVANSLLLFSKLKATIEGVVQESYEVVEAILYLRTIPDGKAPNEENWVGIKALTPGAPLLEDNKADWTTSNGSDNWKSPGAAVTEGGGAYDFSDMYRLPSNFDFNGTIPFLLNREQVNVWATDDEKNKGMVLTILIDSVNYEVDFHSSASATVSYRPLLYVKVKTGTRGRSSSISNQAYRAHWESLTYQEKLAPLHRRNRD